MYTVYSAVEMFLQQQSHPVSGEVTQLKEVIEREKRTEEEEEEEEEGRERGVGCDGEPNVRQLWEVMENVNVSDKLVELEKEVETAILQHQK